MKKALLSFSNSEIPCHGIVEVKSVDERGHFVGIIYSLLFFEISAFSYYLTG